MQNVYRHMQIIPITNFKSRAIIRKNMRITYTYFVSGNTTFNLSHLFSHILNSFQHMTK